MRAQAFFSSTSLQSMNSSISGWSALRITIFAARRVLPPDLITPANASKPFMKQTGPMAVPPPRRPSDLLRMGLRLEPVPEPNLKSIPSVLARPRMLSMVSSTELMKQAEHCGLLVDPHVEPDRAVEGGALLEEDVGQLVVEGGLVLIGREVAVLVAPAADGVGHPPDHLLGRSSPAPAFRACRGSTWRRPRWWRARSSSWGTRGPSARRPPRRARW